MKQAILDILNGGKNWQLWAPLAWRDTRLRYTRTVIGPFWQTLSMSIFICTLGVLYSKFWNLDVALFLPYLAVGMSAWVLVSTVLIEACGVFHTSAAIILQKRLPYSTFVFQLLLRNLIVFLHNLPVALLVLLLFEFEFNANLLFLIPGLTIVLLNLFWLAILLGLLCTRFRDIANLVTSLIQIVFFVTPIFWNADLIQGKHRLFFVDSNPMFHMIEMIRGPLLGYPPPMLSWWVNMGILIIGIFITMQIYQRFRSRIPYWL